ncbi:MAG: PEGA domain-containing protein [Deltaproteobacteria bacterium]|nr:PEGA domain-containing protein [Deltaproteobacteria bacterium]
MSIARAVAVAFTLALVHGSAAHGATVLLAPLGELGIKPDEARQVQRWLQAAFSGLPAHRILGPGRVERQLQKRSHLDCLERPRCVAQLARQVGAELVVTGDVGSVGGGFVVYLRLLDGEGRQLRAVSGVLDPRRAVRDAARELGYQLLLPERYVGALDVRVDVAGAWIYVDGRRLGRSPAPPLSGLAVGPHALRVTHPSYRDFVRFVKVELDGSLRVDVTLSAFPVLAREMRLTRPKVRPLTSRELPWYRRWWAVAAFGAVVTAATATVIAVIPRPVGRDAELVVRPK